VGKGTVLGRPQGDAVRGRGVANHLAGRPAAQRPPDGASTRRAWMDPAPENREGAGVPAADGGRRRRQGIAAAFRIERVAARPGALAGSQADADAHDGPGGLRHGGERPRRAAVRAVKRDIIHVSAECLPDAEVGGRGERRVPDAPAAERGTRHVRAAEDAPVLHVRLEQPRPRPAPAGRPGPKILPHFRCPAGRGKAATREPARCRKRGTAGGRAGSRRPRHRTRPEPKDC
jgi:hypothetical protein